jgi:hypothetical protein
MNRRVIGLLAVLALAPLPARAQTRVWTGGLRSTSTSRPPRPATPPLPATPTAPFRSVLAWRPDHVPPPYARLPIRLPWFGLFAFNPYWYWSPAVEVDENAVPEGPLLDSDRPAGGLQLDVEPRRAMVYVDGRLIGRVEEFSGYFKHLDLPAGLHRLDFVASDFDPLVADLVVSPGHTTTYRASLNRVR